MKAMARCWHAIQAEIIEGWATSVVKWDLAQPMRKLKLKWRSMEEEQGTCSSHRANNFGGIRNNPNQSWSQHPSLNSGLCSHKSWRPWMKMIEKHGLLWPSGEGIANCGWYDRPGMSDEAAWFCSGSLNDRL